MAVRFPHREEVIYEFHKNGSVLESPMMDDKIFVSLTPKPCVLIAEVKNATCSLNDRLIDPSRHNLQRILRAIGLLPREELLAASTAMYQLGFVDHERAYIAFCCIGRCTNNNLGNPHHKSRYDRARVPQITFDQISEFIYGRFATFQNQKRYHHQWGCVGRLLWDLFYQAKTKERYVDAIRGHLVAE